MGKNGAAGLGFYTKEVLAHLGSPFGFGCLLDGFFFVSRGGLYLNEW
jgi:hypothetical protein